MIVLIAIVVAASCATIGHVVGLGVFAALFEPLRHYDLDAILDSRGMLENFRRTFAVLGAVVGFWLILRWRSMDLLVKGRVPTARMFVLATLAGAGGVTIAQAADFGGLAIQYFKVSHENFIGITLGSALLALLIGAGITVGYGRGYRPFLRYLGHAAIASAVALGLIWAYLVFDRGLSQPYEKLGEPKTVLLDIRFPASETAEPDPKTIRVALRSGDSTSAGMTYFWHREDGRLTLRASVEIKERTRDRVIVLSRDDERDRLFRLDLPANPRLFHTFGEWRAFEPPDTLGDQPPPAPENGDYQIRFLIR